jgi:hypothetical protein
MKRVYVRQFFRHWKGALYESYDLVQVPIHGKCVFYRALYGDFNFWLRPKEMFDTKFKLVNSNSVMNYPIAWEQRNFVPPATCLQHKGIYNSKQGEKVDCISCAYHTETMETFVVFQKLTPPFSTQALDVEDFDKLYQQ